MVFTIKVSSCYPIYIGLVLKTYQKSLLFGTYTFLKDKNRNSIPVFKGIPVLKDRRIAVLKDRILHIRCRNPPNFGTFLEHS